MSQKLLIPILGLALLTVTALTSNVKEYGTVSDIARLSTFALQGVINDCSDSSGERVVMPTDDDKTDSLTLRSKMHHISRKARLFTVLRISRRHRLLRNLP